MFSRDFLLSQQIRQIIEHAAAGRASHDGGRVHRETLALIGDDQGQTAAGSSPTDADDRRAHHAERVAAPRLGRPNGSAWSVLLRGRPAPRLRPSWSIGKPRHGRATPGSPTKERD
jgi:hypothetical protein